MSAAVVGRVLEKCEQAADPHGRDTGSPEVGMERQCCEGHVATVRSTHHGYPGRIDTARGERRVHGGEVANAVEPQAAVQAQFGQGLIESASLLPAIAPLPVG